MFLKSAKKYINNLIKILIFGFNNDIYRKYNDISRFILDKLRIAFNSFIDSIIYYCKINSF